MKWLFMTMTLLVLPADAAVVNARPDSACVDLSGRYAIWGDWTKFEVNDPGSESSIAYRKTNARPRLDRYGLGIVARQIVNPSVVVLRQDLAAGVVHAEVKGDGVNLQGIDEPLKMPMALPLTCVAGTWHRQVALSGGGENVPSEMKLQMRLRVEKSGDLIVEGEQVTTSGWLFKKTNFHYWQARFRRIGL